MRVAERTRLRSAVAPPTVIFLGQLQYVQLQAQDSRSNIVGRTCAVAIADSGDSLFSLLRQTLRSWVNSDRVRIVGSQGRSLQMQPGDRLVIGNHCWIVRQRAAAEDPDDAERMRITYELNSEESDAENASCDRLVVSIRKDGSTPHRTTLLQGSQESSIRDEDITILPASQ